MNDMEINLIEALNIAEMTCRKAGELLLASQGEVKVIESKALHDDLLSADTDAERLIISELQKAYHNIGFLSEESGEENLPSKYKWLIDPLDGSANYQHGYPLFAVTIGLLYDNEIIMTAIYLPKFDEMYTAIKGKGAFVNNNPLNTSNTATINRSIIHFGDFSKNGNQQENSARLEQIQELANTVERIRMIGTASTDLAYVASGKADGFIVSSSNPWDIEPGKLLVIEAGGNASIINRADNRITYVFSNRNIHDELTSIILPQQHSDNFSWFGIIRSTWNAFIKGYESKAN